MKCRKEEFLIGVTKIKIHQVPTDGKGNLQFFEANKDIPFNIKRVYYITNVASGVWRGGHAHINLKQLIFCPYGKIQIDFTNSKNKLTIVLDKPDIGILIEKPVWRDILWIIDNSVLCVAASDYYVPEDYIRDYSQFENYMEEIK